MGEIVLLSLVAVLNPTLLAATTLMLLFPSPERMMLGYWLGAMLMSLTLGLVIFYAAKGSGLENTSKHTVHPALELTLAGILLVVVIVLATGRDKGLEERRARRRSGREQKTPRWQRTLSKGTAKSTFVVGALLSFPGATYLAALDRLEKLHYSTAVTVLVIVGFCLMQQLLIEGPLLAYRISPEKTPIAVNAAKAWAAGHWRTVAIWGLSVIAAGLAIIAISELV